MNAEDYLKNHWITNEIWNNLSKKIHQERLKHCAQTMIGETFIDVGCGIGTSTNIMKGFRPGNWTGLDFYDKAIDMAKKEYPNINFISLKTISDISTLNQYDGVVCSEVIEHVENDIELVDVLYGLAKKIIIITTPNRRVNDPGHLRLYTMDSLEKLFKKLKNVTITSSQIGFFYIVICKN